MKRGGFVPCRRCAVSRIEMTCMALVTLIAAADSASCPDTGEPAPSVVTLMASKADPTAEAWVVSPDCKVETLKLSSSNGLGVTARGIERVSSIPTNTATMISNGNPFSQGADLSGAKSLKTIEMYKTSLSSSLGSWALPPALESFAINNDQALSSLEGLKFPSSVVQLSLSTPNLKTLKTAQLPSGLRLVNIMASKLSASDLQFLPAAAERVVISSTAPGDLASTSLPRSLKLLLLAGSGVTSVRGIKLPISLEGLVFQQSVAIATFEIRESDVKTLQNLQDFSVTVSQNSCAGSGKITEVRGVKICVITDNEFESQYGSNPSPTSSTPSIGPSGASISPSTTGRVSHAKSSGGSQDDDGASSSSPTSKTNTTRGSIDGSSTGDGAGASWSPNGIGGFMADGSPNSAFNASNVGDRAGSRVNGTSSARPSRDPTSDVIDAQTESSGSNNSLIAITVSSILTVAVAALLFYVFVVRKRRQLNTSTETPTTDKFHRVDTPSSSMDKNPSSGKNPSSEPTITPSEPDTLAIDFRNDKELVRHRIDQVHVGKQIARGGFGVVYRGTCEGRVVAVKQMLPDAWRSDAMIADFLDEIRMCARLDHPKIVAFIGVSWNSLRDLSVITEFMDGGDLHSVLHKYRESSGAEWKSPWGGSSLRSKTLMAMDVAEAVMYLHSFDTPIIHRDLKAKNVLLDQVGNAKLSDFGISRDVSMDETMTSEIGTAAWIAPEVLRGERYSEKADIYSLGVLLVELDRCRHPYADEPVLLMGSATTHQRRNQNGNSSRVAHKNTQIAVLVSTGKLKPSPSRGCPGVVASVIESCLRFEASDRPTAMEAFYELRQAQRAFAS